ncbi:uncharacterized protein LOC142164016 [Nicotiana tabacum]|uniref:Uncharacterized protein LOC142164016 n=1 Tax=Nicotiana tabacum TaxID=4097 RepID=A0AC58RX25_TOBAC
MPEMKDFRQSMESYGLQELRSIGAFYTWNNKQSGADRVMSRIDSVILNTYWVIDLPASEINFMSEGLYDHCSAMVHWEDGNTSTSRPFKYFNMWKITSDFQSKVKRSWEIRST